MMTPKEKANELIETRIDRWHDADSDVSLPQWLGWSDSEYAVWVETNEPPDREIALHEVAQLLVEARVREADISDGSKVKWGHSKQIRDLKKRIEDLSKWRDKHAKGSETRANYSRLIQRLKSELKSALAAAEKKKKTQRPKR